MVNAINGEEWEVVQPSAPVSVWYDFFACFEAKAAAMAVTSASLHDTLD